MAIIFTVNLRRNYFVSKYEGRISYAEALDKWKNFLEGKEWVPGQNEFVDLSKAQLNEVTVEDLMNLASYIEDIYIKNSIEKIKVAVYAPNDLPFGIARMYSAYADESPELVHVFRDKEEAIRWLLTE